MRRAALPLLLRLAEAAPSQQQFSQHEHLTQLQALLLHATGHIQLESMVIAQLPSTLAFGRTLFGIANKDKNDSLKRKHIAFLDDEAGWSDRRSKNGSVGAVDEDLTDALHETRSRSQRTPTLDDVAILALSRRSRRPRGERAGPVSDPGLPASHASGPRPKLGPSSLSNASPPTKRERTAVRPSASAAQTSETAAIPLSVTPIDRSTEALGLELVPVIAPPPPPPPPPATPPPATATPSPPPATATDKDLRPRKSPSSRRHPSSSSSSSSSSSLSSSPVGDSRASPPTLPSARPRLVPSTGGTSESSSPNARNVKSIHELLDELEKGSRVAAGGAPGEVEAALPPFRLVMDSLEQWRKGRHEDPGRRNKAAFAARLDLVLAPLLMGPYGAGREPKALVFLMWSLIKADLFGDTALALVQRLEDVVRPDISYGKGDYWASLAFYCLGLAQHVAAAGGAANAAVSDGGGNGRWASPAAAAAALVERSRKRLAPALLMLLSRNAATINLQALSNTFWAAGLLQMRDYRRALAPLVAQAYLTAPEAQSQNISNILYGCAVLGLSGNEWAALQGSFPFLERLLSEAVRRRFAGFQPLEVSCVSWAACKLGLKSRPLLEAVSNFVAKGGFDNVTTAQVWANSLYAMGLEDFYDSRVFQKLSRVVLLQPPDPMQTQTGAVQQKRRPGSIMRSATAQTCGNLLFAMGAVRYSDERVVDVLLARMLEVAAAGRASVVDVALAARACAQLNYRSPVLDDLLDAAMPAMKAQAQRLMSYNVLWSMLTLNVLGEPRHKALVQYLVYCTNKYGTNTWKSASTESPSPKSPPGQPQSDPGVATAFDDLTQLVQYHLESRYLGLTGEAYDLKPPQGMDAVVQQVRERRQKLAAQSSTVVHRNVVAALKEMADAPDSVTAGVRHPRILQVDSEVMVEPELVVVDVLLTLAHPDPDPTNPNPDHSREDSDPAISSSSSSAAPAAATAGSCRPARTYKLALEVDGPHHFMRNRPRHQDGPSAYRDRVLRRRLGHPWGSSGCGGVAVVQTRVWVEQLADDAARRRYLAELLAGAAAPPPPPHLQGVPS